MNGNEEVAIIRMRLHKCSIESEIMHQKFKLHSTYEADQIHAHYLSLLEIENSKYKSICVFRTGMIYFYLKVSDDGEGYEICIDKDFKKYRIPFTRIIEEKV